jgi:hypothetical protein
MRRKGRSSWVLLCVRFPPYISLFLHPLLPSPNRDDKELTDVKNLNRQLSTNSSPSSIHPRANTSTTRSSKTEVFETRIFIKSWWIGLGSAMKRFGRLLLLYPCSPSCDSLRPSSLRSLPAFPLVARAHLLRLLFLVSISALFFFISQHDSNGADFIPRHHSNVLLQPNPSRLFTVLTHERR